MKVVFNLLGTELSNIQKLVFHDENNEQKDPCLEIYAKSEKDLEKIFERIKLIMGLNDLGEAPVKLEFLVSDIQSQPNGVFFQVTGNIQNALAVMESQRLLTPAVFSLIKKDEDESFQKFLTNSANFKLASESLPSSVSNNAVAPAPETLLKIKN